MKKVHQGRLRSTPGLAASAVLLSLLLGGCTTDTGVTPDPIETVVPSETPSPTQPSASPSASPRPSPTPTPAPSVLASISVGPDDVQLVFDDGSARPFGYLDEPDAVVSALTEEFGEEPIVNVYAGDLDCGASTGYLFSPGITIRQIDPMKDLQEPGEEGPLGFTVYAVASRVSDDTSVSVTTSAGGELGAPADSLFSSVPASWIIAGEGMRSAVIESSTILGPVQDVDEEGQALNRWGLAVTEQQGVLNEIGSPVNLAYFC